MNQVVSARVEIAQGTLQGVARNGVLTFNGIPYAKPPVGKLRWCPPERAEGWAGVRDASGFGYIALQNASGADYLLGPTPGTQSEDCLYLNVQTPGCDDARRAVMVWIHGGAFVTGAGRIKYYQGKYLVPRGDIVLVTINYRLGAFGFLNLRDASDDKPPDASGGKLLPGTGAEGLADQVMALRWVKDNIAAFGGDPNNVTIFGQSAGGMSVGALLAMPSARGLFHKAIAQSGASDIGKPRDETAEVGRAVRDLLNGTDPLTAPWKDILKIQKRLLEQPPKPGRLLLFGPTVDGTTLPRRAIEAVAEGSAADVPVMTGTTRDEWKVFTGGAQKPRDEAELRRLTVRMLGEENEEHVDALLAAYPNGSPFDKWNEINTDHAFFVPATRLLDAQGKHAQVYGYRFDWPSPFQGGALGSCHALELGFTFGTMCLEGAAGFFGTGKEAKALSHAMMDAWIAFARTGDPSTHTAGAWPPYDGGKRATMIFGDGAPYMEDAPNEARRKAWEAIPASHIGA